VTFEIHGELREAGGRTGSRRLRKLGRVPAIIYGGGTEPRSISLDHNSLSHQMKREAFYTSILTLSVGKDAQQVVVKAVQRHPARPQIMHLDFQRVVEDQEITMHVPIHFLNEANAKGVKEQGGVVDHIVTDVEISCLPRYLPEYLELDVTELELNHLYHLSDIKLPEGVFSVALRHGQDLPVVAVNPPRREEIDIPPVAEAVEVPVAGEEGVAAAGAEPTAEKGEKSDKAEKGDKPEKGQKGERGQKGEGSS
jgi:large subunit ribosomal protein L25